ncbi:MmcB family DNA repair protein [Sneathiella sp.]|uniref:MmcB family DNA repair protein n=1 Tax=Sneathiella sp. TaxID=1964365 RepID=UPI0026320E40|nr:MmcB family DNA repair protein [Sneathiella sp.]MDF2367347.1 MmcB family DNA repair protein [Sneathiella sp.]
MSAARSDKGVKLARGVQKLLVDMGYDSLMEVNLRIRRRVDVMGINDKGRIIIVEVKSGPADYRVDEKWSDYLEFCDEFYFAVDADFPRDLLPETHGLIIADGFGGAIARASSDFNLNAARRRNVTLRFARIAARRLLETENPLQEKFNVF